MASYFSASTVHDLQKIFTQYRQKMNDSNVSVSLTSRQTEMNEHKVHRSV